MLLSLRRLIDINFITVMPSGLTNRAGYLSIPVLSLLLSWRGSLIQISKLHGGRVYQPAVCLRLYHFLNAIELVWVLPDEVQEKHHFWGYPESIFHQRVVGKRLTCEELELALLHCATRVELHICEKMN